jgi:Cu/Ag efflux protein CusF
MRAYGSTAAFILAALMTTGAAAQTGEVTIESRPGTAAASVVMHLTGTITAIDAATRTVTIQGDGGQNQTIVAGPDVRNFAQLGVGDRVDFEYQEALALELKPGSTAPISRTEDVAVAGAAEGEMPAGIGGRRVTVVAEVVALDAETSTVSLKGPNRTVDLKVRDPEQFKRISVGDRVEATYVEAMAVAVTPAAAE